MHIGISLHRDLHSFASKSMSTPPHTVPPSTSIKTKYLTSNSKDVISKPLAQFHPFQMCFEDLVSTPACIQAVREMEGGEKSPYSWGVLGLAGEIKFVDQIQGKVLNRIHSSVQ